MPLQFTVIYIYNLALMYIEDKLQELRGRTLLHYGIIATIRDISPLSNAFIRKLHIILKN